jgi:hypothetical protein
MINRICTFIVIFCLLICLCSGQNHDVVALGDNSMTLALILEYRCINADITGDYAIIHERQDDESLQCLNLKTKQTIWEINTECHYYEIYNNDVIIVDQNSSYQDMFRVASYQINTGDMNWEEYFEKRGNVPSTGIYNDKVVFEINSSLCQLDSGTGKRIDDECQNEFLMDGSWLQTYNAYYSVWRRGNNYYILDMEACEEIDSVTNMQIPPWMECYLLGDNLFYVSNTDEFTCDHTYTSYLFARNIIAKEENRLSKIMHVYFLCQYDERIFLGNMPCETSQFTIDVINPSSAEVVVNFTVPDILSMNTDCIIQKDEYVYFISKDYDTQENYHIHRLNLTKRTVDILLKTDRYSHLMAVDDRYIIYSDGNNTYFYSLPFTDKKTQNKKYIRYTINSGVYNVYGVEMTMDCHPVITNGRTLLPARYVLEPLGGQVFWDGEQRKVTCKLVAPDNATTDEYKENIVELWIDKPTAKINGKEFQIDPDNPDVTPTIINDRTMVPMRFLAESLGCEVEWVADTKEIILTYTP